MIVDRISLSTAVFEDLLQRKLDHEAVISDLLLVSTSDEEQQAGIGGSSALMSGVGQASETGELDTCSSKESSAGMLSLPKRRELTEEERQLKLIEEASKAIFQTELLSQPQQQQQPPSTGRIRTHSHPHDLMIRIDNSNFDAGGVPIPLPLPSSSSTGRNEEVSVDATDEELQLQLSARGNHEEGGMPNEEEEDDEDEDEDFTIIEEIIPGRDFRVKFQKPPLGLTLTKNVYSGVAEVTRVVEGGQAAALDVQVGDTLVGVELSWIKDYDEAMSMLKASSYPLGLVFRRPARKIESRSPAPPVGSMGSLFARLNST